MPSAPPLDAAAVGCGPGGLELALPSAPAQTSAVAEALATLHKAALKRKEEKEAKAEKEKDKEKKKEEKEAAKELKAKAKS